MELGQGQEQIKTFTQDLPVALTEHELETRRDQLIADTVDLMTLESEKKTTVARFMEDITEKKQHLAHEVHVLHAKEEKRSVDCVGFYDYASMEYRTRRDDTGEQLTSRAMTSHERQGDMFRK